MNAFFNDFAAQDKGLGVQDATQIILAFGANTAAATAGCILGASLLCHCEFSSKKGLRSVSCVFVGAGSALGTVGGGWLAQWLYNRRKWQMPVLMGVSTIVATFPVLYIINTRITGDGYGVRGNDLPCQSLPSL